MPAVFDEMGNLIGDFSDGYGHYDPGPSAPVDVAPGWLTPEYYREKIREFQAVLDSMVPLQAQLTEAGFYAYASGNEEQIAEYDALQVAFNEKLESFRSVASALNLAVGGINAVGGNFPAVQMPFGLAAIPAAALVGGLAAVVAAVALITWAKEFFGAVNLYAKRYQHIAAIQGLPPEQQAAALESLRKLELESEKASAAANQSPLTNMAEMAKWGAVAGGIFVLYKIFMQNRSH